MQMTRRSNVKNCAAMFVLSFKSLNFARNDQAALLDDEGDVTLEYCFDVSSNFFLHLFYLVD